MRKRGVITKTREGQNEISPKKATRLRKRIAAEERLLSLYDSPFPDAWERKKRNDIREQILLLKLELRETEKP